MRETAVFFTYLLLCLALAAALAVPLVATGWIDAPPQRIMGRLAQVFILLGLWPFLRWCRLAERGALGLALTWPALRRRVFQGWLIGVGILGLLVLALVALEVRFPLPWSAALVIRLLEKAVAALIGGLLIGVLEELFFRGALFSAIRRHGGLAPAVIGSAALYALVHFLKPGALPPGVAFDAAGAWQMFIGVFSGLFEWRHLDSLVALFVAGVFLALVRERTGHIGWCIGLHAGWVFVIQVSRRATGSDEAATLGFLTGGYDGVIGWLAALWLGLLALGFWWLALARRQRA